MIPGLLESIEGHMLKLLKKANVAALTSSAGLILAVTSGCGSDHTAAHPAAAKQSDAPSQAAPAAASNGGKQTASFRCKSPAGQKINLSWVPSGNTTVYFNNHCAQRRHIIVTTQYSVSAHTKTFTVNPYTKGQKKVNTMSWGGFGSIEVKST